MKRWQLAALAALALVTRIQAGFPGACQTHCTEPPAPDCPDCSCPCESRLPITLFGSEHAFKLICELHCENSCERLRAVQKLGSRIHADFCCTPEVLESLINALQCDSCWEVRRAAAWSLLGQKARTEQAVMALYVSSKLDPHYMVRSRAAEALDILTLCRKDCFKCIFEGGDKLIKELKAQGVKPGSANCQVMYGLACSSCGLASPTIVTEPIKALPKGASDGAKPLPTK